MATIRVAEAMGARASLRLGLVTEVVAAVNSRAQGVIVLTYTLVGATAHLNSRLSLGLGMGL
jgi:hypothetical protein